MANVSPRTALPRQFRIFSGSVLKTIAVITMLIDHIGAFLMAHDSRFMTPLFTHGPSIYRLFRDIGRIALPIYVFLLIEGAMHTRNRMKYGCNLLLFAFLSEIPWNLVHNGSLRFERQNVYFTLFLGYLAICGIEQVMKYEEHQWIQLVIVLLLLWVSKYLNADYGWKGYIFILIMYWFRFDKVAQTIGGGAWLVYEWKAVFAFIPINMYNGTRGFIRGNLKYFFYLFYPVHLFILYLLRYHVF